MAPTTMLASACALLMALAATGAAAQRSGNMAYLPPVPQLPHLAKPEPAETHLVHGRALGEGHGRNYYYSDCNDWQPRTSRSSDFVFGQGVASGDPFSKSVILWTRVTPPAGAPANKPAVLDYCVSKDRSFRKCVTSGSTLTDASVDFTAKVEAKKLKPNTKYFYQWRYRQSGRYTPVYSTIGRTRTLPKPDDEDYRRVRIAHFSCSNFPEGFFTAYGQMARMADRGEIDFLIHTGDYIYEYNETGTNAITDPILRASRNPMPAKEILNLTDYRTRYNQYNSDVDTKAMRASAPLIPVWDDHEFANDAWLLGAQNHQPDTEGPWLTRRGIAVRVYYEMLPIRQANAGDKLQIYRNFEFGKLMKLIMLDTRIIGRDVQNYNASRDPTRSILGPQQKAYLFDQLSQAQSGGQIWKIIGQQILFTRNCAYTAATFFQDQWEGYHADQDAVLGYLESAKIMNTVVLTGDFHAHWAFELPRYPCKAEKEYSGYNETGKGSLAVEFCSSSITSGYSTTRPNPTDSFQLVLQRMIDENPHFRYLERFYKGFAILDIKPKSLTNSWIYAPNLSVPGQYDNMTRGEVWRVYEGTNKLTKVE